MTLHSHHIVPRYLGGGDEPENLVLLTQTQHAMWHFASFQRTGNWQEMTAWKMLSGLNHHPRQGIAHTDDTKQKMSESQKRRLAVKGPWNKGVSGYKTQPASRERKAKVGQMYYIHGVEYISAVEAAQALGISHPTVKVRALSTKFPDYHYVVSSSLPTT